MSRTLISSYILSMLAAVLVLKFHLLPTVLAGLAVHVVTCRLAGRLPLKKEGRAHETVLILLSVTVVAIFAIGAFALHFTFKGTHGFGTLLATSAEILDRVRQMLPADMVESIPSSADELKESVVLMLREHGKGLSSAGAAGVVTMAHILIGMVIGGMTSIASVSFRSGKTALLEALHKRSVMLSESFEKVVFAQVKISLLNTALTAIYLVILLPLFGVHLPMVTLLVALTFIAGLIPVIGNLISNVVIVIISIGSSLLVGGASLLFLVVIHKLEYFLNARIIGHEVNAKAWELLCAMVLLEALFGLSGVIAAPILYSWLKAELSSVDAI